MKSIEIYLCEAGKPMSLYGVAPITDLEEVRSVIEALNKLSDTRWFSLVIVA